MATTATALRLSLPCLPISSLKTLSLSFTNNPSSFLLCSSLPSSHPKPFRPRLFCSSSPPLSVQTQQAQETQEEVEEVEEIEVIEEEVGEEVIVQELPKFPVPNLCVKERKELASYAHGLGKKLKSQQVGKSGVTPSVAASFVENLESNELLKLKIHGSCPGELIDVIKQLETATGSVAVDQIGRTVILYRPSLTKMNKNKSLNIGKPKEFPAFRMQKKVQTPRGSSERSRQFHHT